MELNDSIQQEIENYWAKCNSSFWADCQLISEKYTFNQNALKYQISHTVKFLSFGAEYILLYSYMTIDKAEKAAVPPKDSHLNVEYLKNSLSHSY